MDVKQGELANYCLACLQSDIHLPENWRNDINQ